MANSLISVVIPTFNEVGNIASFCRSVFSVLNHYETEIIIVDDNSPDGTIEEVRCYAEGEQRVKLIIRKGRRGLASAVREGIAASQGSIIVRTDADFQLDPKDILRMVDELMKGNDFVFVSRYVQGGKDLRQDRLTVISSRVINVFCQIMLSPRYKDYTSCLFACRREVFNKGSVEEDGHGEFFISLLWKAHKTGFLIKELPYELLPRRCGYSKTFEGLSNYLSKGIRYVITAVRLRWGRNIERRQDEIRVNE